MGRVECTLRPSSTCNVCITISLTCQLSLLRLSRSEPLYNPKRLLPPPPQVPYGAPTSPRFQPLRPFLSDGGTSGRPSRRATVNSASIPSLSPRITLGSCGGALIDLPDPSHGGAGGVLGLTPDSLKIIISGGGVEGIGGAPTGRSAESAMVASAAVIVTAHPASHTAIAAAAAVARGGPAAAAGGQRRGARCRWDVRVG